ncbi:MAG: RelA/SpoT family protein [Patescibacteria group bacterium]|jgi:GTP pyrophosphokinase
MDTTNFADLKRRLDANYQPADVDVIRRAYDYAQSAHEGQLRATGEPYFIHCFAVGLKLADLKLPSEVIAAGILHDVPEDTKKTVEDLRAEFGDDIANMVSAITKLGHVKYRGEERYVQNLRKMFVAMAEDVRVIFIKFADRMHNLETLYALPEHKRLRIAKEVLEIYAPIANRLGMGEYRGQFEDYAFKYIEPKEYGWTKHLLEERVKKFGPSLESAMRRVNIELHSNSIQHIDIHGRVKHCYSLWRKLQKYKNDMGKIYDIVAMRIVVKDITDCYAVLGLLHGLYTPLPGRIKDYIAQPKPNGYQSLHTTVFDETGSILEFQIRTQEMHEESEYGVAAHWRYKQGATKEERNVAWMEELSRIQKELTTADFMTHLNELKLDMFQDRIFVFTPKGDVIDLPEDSTPIDMAYAIHTEIGNKVAQAKVNGEIASLDKTLLSGDVCELIIDKNRKSPNKDWLKFVKTRHAKSKIRAALSAAQRGLLSTIWGKMKR